MRRRQKVVYVKDILPLPRMKISDEVTRAIEDFIVENNLETGDKLPSQAELSAKLHVGTRSIREAIRSLESRGMVETKQGKGVFVKNNNLDYFLETLMASFVFHLPEQKELFLDLTKTRRIIEVQAIYDVTQNPPPNFVSQFTRIVEELDAKAKTGEIDAYNLLDLKLHQSIINATGNKILMSLYRYLRDLLVKCFGKTGYVHGSIETSITDHHKMLEALQKHDAVQAKAVMESHIGLTLSKIEHLSLT